MNESIVHKSFKIETKQDFEILFNTQYSNLCAYANNFLKDIDAAEEVVQEILFKLWTNRDLILITTSIQSYLFRSVRNACLNVLKHINIREDYKIQNEYEMQNSISSEDEMIVTELEQKIRTVIDQLPSERKKIFIMSRYEGLKYSEIAQKLNLSVSTVENQMVKALKYLREELIDYLPWVILFFGNFFKTG